MVMERLEVEGVFKDEISSRLDNVLSTMVEFGATTEQVARAQDMLSKASATGSRGLAQQTNVLRTLVDESEDADAAMRNVSRAFELAAVTGEKAEDAGRKLGRLLKGDTSVLRAFDAQARRVADAIDKIADPAQRAAAAQRELTRAMQRQKAASTGLIGATRKLDVSLSRVGLSTASLATSVGAVAAAMAGAGVKAYAAYIKDNNHLNNEVEQLSEALDKLEITTGRTFDQMFKLSDQIEKTTIRVTALDSLVGDLTNTFETSDSALMKLARGTAEVAEGVFNITQNAIPGVIQFKLLKAAAEDLGFALDDVAESQGIVADQRRGEFGTMRDEIRHYQDLAHAIRGVAIEEAIRADDAKKAEALRKRQISSGQITIDPNTGQETIRFGPARARGRFDAPSNAAKTPKGGRRPKGPARADVMVAGGLASGLVGEALQFADRGQAGALAGQQVRASMAAQAGTASAALAQGLPALRENLDLTKTAIREMQSEAAKVDAVFTDLANGGIALAGSAISGLAETLAAGEASLASFGRALLSSLGDLITQAGQAFLLLGAGIENIKTGITSPAALIAIGVGMLALGGALKGFAARGQDSGGRAGGGTAQALERFGRRLFDREVGQESREVTINIEGRSMRGFVLDVAADGARRGQISPLTPVRRT